MCEEECPQPGSVCVVDDLWPAASQAPASPLCSHLHQELPERAATSDARLWNSEERLVGLDSAREPVPAGTDHRGPVAVQHRPGGLGGPDLEHTLQAKR